jgi:hypothetical protein
MAGAHQIARLISAGHLSAREVVSACIARIETTNRSINALVVPRFDEALAEADLADGRRRRGEALGALHGVPITVKESFDLAGTPSTAPNTTARSSRICAVPGRSSSERPTSLNCSSEVPAAIRSTDKPTIRGASIEAPARAVVVKRRLSRSAVRRLDSAATSAAASACQPTHAACTASSRHRDG